MQQALKPQQVRQYRAGRWEAIDGSVITEKPVSLTVNGEVWLTFMCTPLLLDAMALGFLYNEQIIESMDDVAEVRICKNGENVDVWLTRSVENPRSWRRTSGCTGGMTATDLEEPEAGPEGGLDPGAAAEAGVLHREAAQPGNHASSWEEGRESVQRTAVAEFQAGSQASPTSGSRAVRTGSGPRFSTNGFRLSPEQVSSLVSGLFETQELYREAGGVHNSGLSDGHRLLVSAEDIGRHNTLDKIAGLCLLEGIRPEHAVLVTTGRVSSEMMQKAARIGAAIVISRTSPSSYSVELARRLGITLIGYARRDRFTVYAWPERISIPAVGQADTPKDN